MTNMVISILNLIHMIQPRIWMSQISFQVFIKLLTNITINREIIRNTKNGLTTIVIGGSWEGAAKENLREKEERERSRRIKTLKKITSMNIMINMQRPEFLWTDIGMMNTTKHTSLSMDTTYTMHTSVLNLITPRNIS